MSKNFFITGIGTDVGKTIISAILVEALQADYWKPVQCGDLAFSDTDKVRSLISNTSSVFHPETYRLEHPYSPHKAAALANTTIQPELIQLPASQNTLITEGAGGLMVPLTNQFLVIDLIAQLQTAVILVSRNYLGSINHTLLSIAVLTSRNIPIAGIVFNGDADSYSEEVILAQSQLKCLARVPFTDTPNKAFVLQQAKQFAML